MLLLKSEKKNNMADAFFEQSKEIANRFIQNIVFIDDKAYVTDSTKNAFDASELSRIFAENGKICAIYAPQSVSEIAYYNVILKKTDVVILDWYLGLKNENADPEADAEADEPRGEHTKLLIKELVNDSGSEKLKLVIIYTGETDLLAITDNIYDVLDQSRFTKTENCSIESPNFNIIIRAKSQNSDRQFEHLPKLKPMIVNYEDLPLFVLGEFTKMTNGLLSNFALSAISTIRDNTSRILNVFSPMLDPAYLGHKILLQNSSDAKQLLIKLFGDAISELVELANIDTHDWSINWINNRIIDHEIDIEGIKININKDLLLSIINSTKKELQEKINEATKISLTKKKATKNSSCLFSYGNIDIRESNVEFAKLTHHKSIFLPKTESPLLTLGTIVKGIDAYYFCIQQKCDSVRIEGDRRFLFLPLTTETGKFSIVINKDLNLYAMTGSYDIKTIKFKPETGENIIKAQQDKSGKYLFHSIWGETFEWIVDLKDMHAQRIITDYCSQLSRVGVDESEWLRMQ